MNRNRSEINMNRYLIKIYILNSRMIKSYRNTGNGIQCMYINYIRNQDIKQANPTVLEMLGVITVQLVIVLRIPVLVAYKRTLGVT